MKKYIFLALLTMGVSSCQLVDVLDQKPEFEADLDGAITTPAAVELALNGIYYSLPGNGFNVIFPTVSGSFKAGTMWRQEIVSAGNAVYYSERMLPTLSFSDATEWDADYAVIKNANFLETACNRMSDGEFSGNRRAEVLGEIAYLRALAYFNILVRYCEFWDMNSEYGVVMRNEAPSVSNALKVRSSVADSYQYILDQLEIAIEKAPDWKKLSQASKEAAKALKARVLLYAGKYTEAVAAVNDAIDTNSPLPEANYGDVFDKFSTTKEILFARVFDQKDATNTSTRQQCYGNSPTKKQGYWGPTNEYVELVGDDPRADAIFSKVDSLMDSRSSAVAYNLKSVKKLLNDANDMPVIFSRVSELYLIKAEALYRSGASISEAYAPIRKLRERAGAEIILPANNEELETAIFNEWMLELSFENWHEWFAMIRFAGYTEKPDFTRLLALNKTLREALEKEYEKSEAQGDNYYQRIIDRRIDAIPSSEISSNLECKQNVHRSSSRQTPEQFIQTGKDANIPTKRSFYLQEQYTKGNRERAFLIDYINYHYSVYARNNVQAAFDELIKGGAKLTDPDVWEVYVNTINGMNPYLKQVSDNYADFCQRFGKKAVDAKLAKETSYGELAEIEALCNYEGKDFNLKMIRINNDIREQKYEAAATQIDAMIADTTVNQQELISRLKFIARLGYKAEELPEFWFNKCVGYLQYIAYNQTDRDDAFIHQEYAAALEMVLRKLNGKAPIPACLSTEPAYGKKVYNMRPDALKMKPKRKK